MEKTDENEVFVLTNSKQDDLQNKNHVQEQVKIPKTNEQVKIPKRTLDSTESGLDTF